jgi:DNA-binding GntR family transcriptional regulator
LLSKASGGRSRSQRGKVAALEGGLLRSEAVLRFLFEALREGKLRAGDRLREAEIAKQLKVSRIPVREAFGRLTAKGLVEAEGGKGLIVRGLDPSEIVDIYSVREILEGAAAGLAARHASKADHDLLWDIEKKFENVVDDWSLMARLNGAIHEAIFRAARNRFLDDAVRDLQDFIALLGRTTSSVAGRRESAAAEHREMIKAIAERDHDKAESAARVHVPNSLLVRLQMAQADVAPAMRRFSRTAV